MTANLMRCRPLTAALHPNVPSRSALAAAFSTFVVRVHTRHGIRTLSFDALAVYFTSTAKTAADELGISSRTLIRVCRSLGIRRWPYLGFRSEKNVERVRQEAIDNLRRRLEKRGGGATPADDVVYPDATGHRGASAKRLLQVKGSPTMEAGALVDLVGSGSDDDDQSMRSSFDSHDGTIDADVHALVTPQHISGGFHFDLQRISPRKVVETPPVSTWTPKVSLTRAEASGESQVVPSLHLLVDASLLTSSSAFTHRQSALHSRYQPRTMSMRDILSSSPATA